MKRISLLLVLGLAIISLAGCGEIETREKILPDGSKVIIDSVGNVIRSSLPTSFASLIDSEVAKRLGVTPADIENKPPEEVEKLSREFKNTLSAFSQTTISSAHKLLNCYFWPESEIQKISLKQLKQEIAELKKEWKSALAVIEEFKDIPAVEAYINDVNRAFEEVEKSSIFNRKSLETAHNIFHDLESIWWKTDPPEYGVTETEKILADNLQPQKDEEYIYDKQTGRYINETTGVWYVVKDGYKVIPPEEYIDRAKVETIDGINITDRPDDVWELKEIREITIKSGDTLVDIIKPAYLLI